jgi:predicted RNA-binding protein associated with RNAse of E/G family
MLLDEQGIRMSTSRDPEKYSFDVHEKTKRDFVGEHGDHILDITSPTGDSERWVNVSKFGLGLDELTDLRDTIDLYLADQETLTPSPDSAPQPPGPSPQG